mmetsp:Transcript_2735/g.3689  ORF Transcript_2735/g.3689 Transcript_2735/m.3689 type:complete len:303 (-) Transcript_2735:102-1010(-)
MQISVVALSALFLGTPEAQGFSIGRSFMTAPQKIGSTTTTTIFSEPSDTSSDDWDDEIVDIDMDEDEMMNEVPPMSPQDDVKLSNLMDLMPASATAEVSSETRAAINEALYQLEKLNPTKETTVSPLINGVWDLKYAGGYSTEGALASPTRQLALFLYSGGYSPGLFVLSTLQRLLPGGVVELQNMEVSITRSQPRVEASVQFRIGNGSFTGTAKVVSRLETMTTVRMKETYESASFQGNSPIEIPSLLQYSRDIYVTYVDEDILIVRDDSGVPEVLVRKEKVFPFGNGPEPSDVDDMGPPL